MPAIRKSTENDLIRISEIFEHARRMMKENGNPDQWKDDRPSMKLVEKDIREGNSYVVEDEGKVVATFAFIIGSEPTYRQIDGAWLNDKEYGTIHRIASDGSIKGIFETVLDYVSSFKVDIRIDTHKDNAIMKHLILKNGFKECGIIIVDDGSERIAYQKEMSADE